MRLRKPKPLYEAKVQLSGLADDPFSSELVAVVTLDDKGRGQDPKDVIGFVPMTVVAILRGLRNGEALVTSFCDLLEESCNELMSGDENDARAFRLAGSLPKTAETVAGADWWGPDEMAEAQLRMNLPRTADETTGGKRAKFLARLRVAGAMPFVDIYSRNPFFGVWGTLAIFEEVARRTPYEATARPTAAAVLRTLDLAREYAPGFPRPLGFDEATLLYAFADQIALSDDPSTWDPGGSSVPSVEAATSTPGAEGAPPTPTPEGTALDPKQWVDDTAGICTNRFEPFVEHVLEVAALELLHLDSFEGVEGEIPDAVVSNARFGYALRNRECQLMPAASEAVPAEQLAEELDGIDSPYVIPSAMLSRVLYHLIVAGGADQLLQDLPGAPAAVRQAALEEWLSHWTSDVPYVGREDTRKLVLLGYFMHRVIELRPELAKPPG